MRALRNIIDRTWEKLLVIIGALFVLLPASPLNMPLTYRDSGVFLYMGWRILHGELPYRDLWDHKPPVIFYINALGLAVTNNSRWGVWLIELAALFLAAFLGFQLIKKNFGVFPAIFSFLLWLLSLVPLLQGGNFTTEYTLPLQFAALWLVYKSDKPDFTNRYFFLIGLTGAIAFFTKQTAIGIWIAIVIYITVRNLASGQIKQWLRELSLISLGGLTVSAIVLIFFGIQNALPQFWGAAFEYNFFYASFTSSGLSTRWDSIIDGVRPLTKTGLLQFSLIGYVCAILLILIKKSSVDKFLPLLFVGLINLPIEFMLIGISRKIYPHYFMTILPVLSLFVGLTVWTFILLTSTWKIPNPVKYFVAIVIMGFFVQSSSDNYINQFYTYRKLDKNEAVIKYIKDATTPDDSVLLWGAESSVNYFAQRKSPTRFVYQYPLQREGYVNEELIVEFLDDVIRNRPRLIINADPLTPLYEFPIQTAAMDLKIAYLQAHYCPVQNIDSWAVYKYAEDQCAP